MFVNRRIAVIGDMQMGKSFFIKALYQYAGVPVPENLEIGNGFTGKTKEITTYTINGIVPKEFPLKGDIEGVHETELYDKLCDGLIPFSTTCEVGTDWTLNLEVIDTPGLGCDNDAKTLETIAQKLKKESLHALIMVFKISGFVPTGPARKQIKRILEKFPEYHDKIRILHIIDSRSKFTKPFVEERNTIMKEICQAVDLTDKIYYVDTYFNQRFAKEENLCLSYREMKAFLTNIVKIPK